MTPVLRSGDVLLIGRAASVQFATPILARVIRVHNWTTYQGWVWLDIYEVNSAGQAIDRRSVFVQVEGLRKLRHTPGDQPDPDCGSDPRPPTAAPEPAAPPRPGRTGRRSI